MKSLLMAVVAAVSMAVSSATAQTSLATAFPSPAAGEMGPQAEVSDGLNLADHVSTDGLPQHVDGEAAPDTLGAFRFICGPAHVLADDPVVFPGKPGYSHAHQFYGNVLTNGLSTYASQRMTGLTSCGSQMNRSGYWMPAMITKGQVLRPNYVIIYYKREPASSKYCNPSSPDFIGICVPVPNAIRFIFGADMVSGTVPTGNIAFACHINDGGSNPQRPGTTRSSDLVTAAKGCLPGDLMSTEIFAPHCWDGKNLDSSNHRSHTNNREDGGYGRCPSSHPYYMPHFELKAEYVVDDYLDNSGTWEPGRKTWYLSSDIMFGMTPRRPGSTFHADYFEAWNNRVKKAWTDNCINRHLNCSANDLGNGYRADAPRWPDNLPRYLPIPAGIRGPYLGNKLHAGH